MLVMWTMDWRSWLGINDKFKADVRKNNSFPSSTATMSSWFKFNHRVLVRPNWLICIYYGHWSPIKCSINIATVNRFLLNEA